jgi:DNA invertase Pin-like site-specific DNA recombinase
MSTAHSSNGGALRFGALVRVSTEKQEQRGESLKTQRDGCLKDAEALGGAVVEWYGGQEHGTAGWERKELDRLLADAGRGKWDAVLVQHADRWSRDNGKSKEGLDTLRRHGRRFYVSVTEYDLYNPEHCLFLGLSAEIGEFQARHQARKAMLNKIARARRGVPTAGKLPYGRTYVRPKPGAEGVWGIDPKKQATLEDIARRYLGGESLLELAEEYSRHYPTLCRTLQFHAGTEWKVNYHSDALNIDEDVVLTVPRLLPEETIKAIRRRVEANKTYRHGDPKHPYLLNGRVFCEECGFSLFGNYKTTRGRPRAYYRHARHPRALECPFLPRPHVPGEWLEKRVVEDLFKLFGNPSVIEKATRDAVPDCDKLRRELQQVEGELARVERATQKLVRLIADDLLTDAEAEKQLREQKDRRARLGRRQDALAEQLAELPTQEQLRRYVECTQTAAGRAIFLCNEAGKVVQGVNDDRSWHKMGRAERRRLIDAVFDQPPVGGKVPGVYVRPDKASEGGYSYRIVGRLDFEVVTQCPTSGRAAGRRGGRGPRP